MGAYLCVWPNGDLSIVKAHDKNDAVLLLDEVGGADRVMLRALPLRFMLHLKRLPPEETAGRLTFVLEGWGEETENFIEGLPEPAPDPKPEASA